MRKTNLINTLLLLFMLLISARFLLVGWNRILLNSNSAEGDQSVYLQLGLEVREQGTLTDGKRHPLYPIILAPFAEREWWYFTWAKIVNLGIGLVTIWAVYLIGRSLFNPITGALAAFLLSINIEFIFHSAFALTEPLLILLFVLGWFTMVRALQKPEQLDYWIAAGGLAGLAYLAKGTGPLIAICFIITATLLFRVRIWQQRPMWSFVASFCLVSLPLWLFNWLNFGSPLFNSTFTNIMWMDSAADKYVASPSAMPTLSTYLQQKSLPEMWARLWEGLLTMRYFFTKVLWPTRSLEFDNWFQAGRIDLILIIGVGLLLISWRSFSPVVKRHRESLLLTAILVAVYYLLFGWYIAITPFPVRFLLTLVPILYLMLSAGVVGLIGNLFLTQRLPGWAKVAVGVGIVFLALWSSGWFAITSWLIAQTSQRNAFAADAEFNEYLDQALLWTQIGHNHNESVTVMWGPTHMLPTWKHSGELNLVRTPVAEVDTLTDLEVFMQANNVAYVIVDKQMVDRMANNLVTELGIEKSEDTRLSFSNYPPDWALGFVGPAMPCQYCVFRQISATPTIETADFRLGESIHLFGYEILADKFRPGGQIVVTLYWESQRPVSTDYTVFTQLLGPDFQLHAQMDQQPLSGRWPTSRWQPGQKFVDKFVLRVGETAPPGEYGLLVGLYEANTGQRLPVTVNDVRLQDDAIRLLNLTMPTNLPPQ